MAPAKKVSAKPTKIPKGKQKLSPQKAKKLSAGQNMEAFSTFDLDQNA